MLSLRNVNFWAGTACVLALVAAGMSYFQELIDWQTLPLWDEASHAAKGARFTKLILEGHVLAFLDDFYSRNGLWPPLYGMFQMPFYAAAGYDFEISRMLTRLFWAGGGILIFWAGYLYSHKRSVLVGFSAAALFLLSPSLHAFANLTMLEVPGAVLMVAVVALYAKAHQSRSSSLLKAAYLSSFLFFITKYNYAMLFILPMMIYEWRTNWSNISIREVVSKLVAKDDLKRPFFWILVLYFLFLIGVHFSGGFVWQINDEHTIFLRKITGNPLYIFLFLTAVYFGIYKRHSLQAVYDHHLNQSFRSWLHWFIVPTAIWLLNPPNFRNFFGHTVNHSTTEGIGFLDTVAMYPQAFVADFHIVDTLGWSLLASTILSLLFIRKLTPSMRFIGLLVLCAALMLTMHQHKASRHLSPILPMLWFWALAWVGVIEAKLVEVRWLRLLPSVVMVSLTVLIITSQAMQNDQAKAGHAYFNYSEKPEHLLPALDCLCNISKDQPGTFVVGIWNRLSAALVSQYCWSKHAPFPVLNSPQAVSANRILYGGGDWQRLQNRHGIETLLLTHYSGTYQKEFNFDTGRAQESYEAVRASEHFVRKPDLQCGELYRFEVYKAVTLER